MSYNLGDGESFFLDIIRLRDRGGAQYMFSMHESLRSIPSPGRKEGGREGRREKVLSLLPNSLLVLENGSGAPHLADSWERLSILLIISYPPLWAAKMMSRVVPGVQELSPDPGQENVSDRGKA